MEDPKQTRNESPKKHLEILTTNSHIKDKLILLDGCNGCINCKDDSIYQAFKEITWPYSKFEWFGYRTTFLRLIQIRT